MEALSAWLRGDGAYMHPSVSLARSDQDGTYFKAEQLVQSGETIIAVPHSLALSALNAQVDDAYPVFKDHAHSFTVEALGYFYLIAQYVNRERSFWKPYLDTLPGPKEDLGTPFYHDDEDLRWLDGTELEAACKARHAIWERYWMDGLDVMAKHGMETEEYTWELFLWAATMYSSRSFSSRVIHSQSTESWTSYKDGSSGERQTVLLDLSSYPADWKDFPVLFPLMDAGNHSSTSKVDWSYDPGQFVLTLSHDADAGSQIFNNYGPKANDELLMGYGFCIQANPNDRALLSMRPPPPVVQGILRGSHPSYFNTDGDWNSDAATFDLKQPPIDRDTPDRVWQSIPLPLQELLYYLVRHERGLALRQIQDIETHLHSGAGKQYLPRIAYHLVMSLIPRIQKIETANRTLSLDQPTNQHQRNAKIYREAQLRIMSSLRTGLATYLKSLRRYADQSLSIQLLESSFYTLSDIFGVSEQLPVTFKPFKAGIKYSFGTTKVRKLAESSVEDVVWILWVCYFHLAYRANIQSRRSATGHPTSNENDENRIDNDDDQHAHQQESFVGSVCDQWFQALVTEYGDPFAQSASHGKDVEMEEHVDLETGVESQEATEEDEEAAPILACVHQAAMFLPGSLWTSNLWTRPGFILDWGARIVRSQGMNMAVDDDEVRFVVFLAC